MLLVGFGVFYRDFGCRSSARRKAFFLLAAAVSAQSAPRGDDAVAGDQDADRVAAIGVCHGADRFGVAESFGLLCIRDRFTVGDRSQRLPNRELKRRPAGGDGKVKGAPLACEILPQLFFEAQQEGMVGVWDVHPFVREIERDDRIAVGGGDHRSQRCVDQSVQKRFHGSLHSPNRSFISALVNRSPSSGGRTNENASPPKLKRSA